MSQTHKTTILIITLFLALPVIAGADYGGQQTTFFVDDNYDLLSREQLTATLIRITPLLYFYLDNNWWGALSTEKQGEIKTVLQNLGEEFENKIYPTLNSVFGGEWNPGIDKDSHLTILIHPMRQEAGGYTNLGDEYPRLQVANSNQREMVYLNSAYIASSLVKSFLAHEFVHLITFNQKERKHGLSEEVWLNEARAEYSSTLLGYDEPFQESNLQRRLRDFLQKPTDSLTEWKNEKVDYGVLNLFVQYLVDHYGIEILADSLHSEKVGILALNYALKNRGADKDFSQIFTDWTIAVFLNDCQKESFENYCYKNKNLDGFHVVPSINFLPLTGKSTLSVTASTKDWAANWYKFIGGKGQLKLEFIGYPDIVWRVPYLTQNVSGDYSLSFLELNKYNQGKLLIPEFGKEIISLVLMPSIQNKLIGFGATEPTYSFFWSVSTQEQKEGESTSTPPSLEKEPVEKEPANAIEALVKKIEFLEQQLTLLRTQLKEQLTAGGTGEIGSGSTSPSTGPTSIAFGRTLDINLKYGDRGDDVRHLQTWLAKDPEIYPEALITGYFGSLTKAAVNRFQEKYRQDILGPWNLTEGTGFVGPSTRTKLNTLYGKE